MRSLAFIPALMAFLVLTTIPFSMANAQSVVWEEMATNISVYVRSHDAKFVGTSMGGAHIRITNKMTGDVLAEGLTYGSTGNTDMIMAENKKRDEIIVDKDTASFDVSLDIMEPMPVIITATAPLAQPQSMVSTSVDYVLIPYKDYSGGNGIIIDLPGMSVDILTPMAGHKVEYNPEKPVTIMANITKLCGCQIDKSTHWPPERYDVEAHLFRGTNPIGVIPMRNLGQSQYAANLKIPVAGTYNITVTAFDRETKEGGFDKTTVILVTDKEEKTEAEQEKDKKEEPAVTEEK